MQKNTQIKRALISVSDKTGILELGASLHSLGIEIISTGNTAKLLQENNIPAVSIENYTGFPEILNGRVKTLHPKVHGGILGQRDIDKQELDANNIPNIDLVIVNLYPFKKTVNSNASFEDIVENIDIGGPTMIRAAAKNFAWTTVIVCNQQYQKLINELKENNCETSKDFRFKCMQKAFEHTADYERSINNYFNKDSNKDILPDTLNINYTKKNSLRYGENPHQKAALYVETNPDNSGIAACKQHQGKDLSFNNINDSETALECVKSFNDAACVIVKHANPCGVAINSDLEIAYQHAYNADPESAFGGIIAFNKTVEQKLLESILEQQFVEVIIAPNFTDTALKIAKHKPNIRILSYNEYEPKEHSLDIRSIRGGLLVQTYDTPTKPELAIVTKKAPTKQQMEDCHFAWQVCHFVKSNAIVLVKDGKTLGIGAGQSSRIFSTHIAKLRADKVNMDLNGAVMASDAFFPFADNVELAKELGISVIIQPGGSIRDNEIIKRADELDVSMITTSTRHFKH
jgi:phosphoribosylaminoimidazolecarboxamide formyltransferase/IMP cyclohydrolase